MYVTVIMTARTVIIRVFVIMFVGCCRRDQRRHQMLGHLHAMGFRPGKFLVAREAAALAPTLLGTTTAAAVILARERR